jgi:hypothetical protein
MKDSKYLLLVICFVIVAHATKKTVENKNQAKFLPDIPDFKVQKETDSGRVDASYRQIVIPAIYNSY